MSIHEFPKGLDYKNGLQQIYCLQKDFGKVRVDGIDSGSKCNIIDKGFELVYEQETQQWYKQKTLSNGELLSPKTIEFLSTDWSLVTIADTDDYIEGTTLYKLTITHTLNTTLFDGYVYDSSNELMVANLSAVDVNSIKIVSDEIFNGKVVLI